MTKVNTKSPWDRAKKVGFDAFIATITVLFTVSIGYGALQIAQSIQ